jgi:hypothetical protein
VGVEPIDQVVEDDRMLKILERTCELQLAGAIGPLEGLDQLAADPPRVCDNGAVNHRSLPGMLLPALLVCAGCSPSASRSDDPLYECPDPAAIRRLDAIEDLLDGAPTPSFATLVYANYPAVPGGGHLPRQSYSTRVELVEAVDGLTHVLTDTRTQDGKFVRHEIGVAGLVDLGILDTKDFISRLSEDIRYQFRIEALSVEVTPGPLFPLTAEERRVRVRSSYALWDDGERRDLGEIEQTYRFRLLSTEAADWTVSEPPVPGPLHRIHLELTDPDGTAVEEILWSPALGAVVQRRYGQPVHTHVQLERWSRGPAGDPG